MGERLVVETLVTTPVAARRIELVERKGTGHPDTICDALVEAISQALSRLYLERAGVILHYNVDKAFLVAGECRKGFGGGDVIRPIEFIVGDRATLALAGPRATTFPVENSVRAAVEAWIGRHLPHLRPKEHLHTRVVLAPASTELRAIYETDKHELEANDTSAASGYAPLSPTEELVLAVERYLNGAEFKAAFPDTGEDVKVFALRRDSHVSVTVAMPFRCEAISSEAVYFNRKEAVLAALAERFRAPSLPGRGWSIPDAHRDVGRGR
jgi:S-adenosylmethionine synthetase